MGICTAVARLWVDLRRRAVFYQVSCCRSRNVAPTDVAAELENAVSNVRRPWANM